MLLVNPKTIREAENLGALKTVVYRKSGEPAASKLYQAYIKNGNAYVAVCDNIMKRYDRFVDLYEVGPAKDVAIAFDGYWEQMPAGSGKRHDFVSIGEPWIFRKFDSGDLVAQQGSNGDSITLAEGVTGSKIYAMRGWRNIKHKGDDFGLIVGYIKDGELYYRTLAEQKNGEMAWESSRKVNIFEGTVNSFSIFRTADYRMGIAVEIAGKVHAAVTTRNWVGMAIPDHTVTITCAGLNIDFVKTSKAKPTTAHSIPTNCSIKTLEMIYGLSDNAFLSAENYGPATVYATTKRILTNLTAEDFTILDDDEDEFRVTAIGGGIDLYSLVLTVENLNYANQGGLGEGNLTLHFLGSGDTKGEAGQDIDPFDIVFEPTGLEFIPIAPPAVEAIWNE